MELVQSTTTRVFPAGPRVGCYFPAEAAERARTALSRCIERMDGPALLIGPSGCGKSLLLGVLAESFREKLSVAVLTGGHLRTARELHQGILYALGLPFSGMDEGELRLTLIQRLESEQDGKQGVLLLVDEAQLLSPELVEELRLLTNIVREGASRARLVLAGTPELEELLTDVHLASFQQRIALRSFLTEMSRAETKSYVQAHLSAAGRDVELFSSDGIQQVYEATDGLPRLVNQLCDHALLLAHADGVEEIDAALVDEAWHDLQQLPGMPSFDAYQAEEEGCEDVLEFGNLAANEEPEHRLDAIQDHLASIHVDDSRVFAEEESEGTLHVHDGEDEDVDFSLPDNKWPEVEVVLRDGPMVVASEFHEEEVISEPFLRASFGHPPAWASGRGTTVSSRSEGAPSGVEDEWAVPVAVPLQSVPLMVQVETQTYAPDPVWPEEPSDPLQSDSAATMDADVGSAPIAQHEQRREDHVTDSILRQDEAPAAPPQVEKQWRPKPKRFANLFTTLQR